MATVAQKVFFAHLHDDSGTLARVDGQLMFFSDAGDITTVEPADITFLTVLGEVGLADTQRVLDVIVHGGYAAVACSREEGVQ